jgi:hypothetical protein
MPASSDSAMIPSSPELFPIVHIFKGKMFSSERISFAGSLSGMMTGMALRF